MEGLEGREGGRDGGKVRKLVRGGKERGMEGSESQGLP